VKSFVKSKLVVLVLTLVFVFAAIQTASAGWGGGQSMKMRQNPVNMTDQLGLTAEQAAKIRQLQESQQKAMTELQGKLRQARFELRQLSFTPGATEKQLESKAAEVQKLQQQKLELMQQHRDQIRAILTDEQLARWSEVRNGGPCPNPNGPMSGPMGGRGAGNSGFCPFGQTR
jgi:Spy/CpxP family protein refolding chaperone